VIGNPDVVTADKVAVEPNEGTELIEKPVIVWVRLYTFTVTGVVLSSQIPLLAM
jgi:hypothetical protein